MLLQRNNRSKPQRRSNVPCCAMQRRHYDRLGKSWRIKVLQPLILDGVESSHVLYLVASDAYSDRVLGMLAEVASHHAERRDRDQVCRHAHTARAERGHRE